MLAAVWEHSRHSGNDLLMMLAIADFADDDGKSYPAVQTLAKKCRMTPRNVNRVLAELRKGGELHVRQNEGPKGTNLYRIALPLTKASPLTELSPLTKPSRTPDGTVPKPLTKPSDEPSVNRQEPSVNVAALRVASKPATPSCPHDEIIAAYHELLPACLPVKVWNTTRRAYLQQRWREDKQRQSVEWWRRFFAYVAKSEFLTGRADSQSGRDPFVADLEWLVRPKNFVKVIEGRYHAQEATP